MPASESDPVVSALRVSFKATTKNCHDVNTSLEASARQTLLQPIEFEMSECESTVLTSLKSKYTVINPPAKCKLTVNGLKNHKLTSPNGVVTLPEPKTVLFPLEKVHLGYKGNVSVGLGMINLGNTCYLNSTLQALFHVPAFVNWLREEPRHLRCEQNNESSLHPDDVMCAVIKTFKSSQQKTGSAIRPISVYSKLKAICKHLNQGTQEDAHEFMRYLLESIEKSFLTSVQGHKLESSSKETTPVNQIFGGYIRTEVVCLTCHAISTTFQHFQDLPLDIRRASTLQEALDGYFERERLPEGEDAYKCDKCGRKVLATKKFSIERPPNVLSLQLKRFSMMNGKLTKQIQLPQQLNLTNYLSSTAKQKVEHPVRYKLVSLVSHVGSSINCGHYTASALAADGNYYLFDDQLVRSMPLSSVLNTSAYLVLYEMERPFTQPKIQPTSTACTLLSTSTKSISHPEAQRLSFVSSPTCANSKPLISVSPTSKPVKQPLTIHLNNNNHKGKNGSLVPYESDGADDSDVEVKTEAPKTNGWRITAAADNSTSQCNGNGSLSSIKTSNGEISKSKWEITDIRSCGTDSKKSDNDTNSSDDADGKERSRKRLKKAVTDGDSKENGEHDENAENRALCEKIAREADKRRTNIVNELLQSSHRGYGSSTVKSWDGGSSAMERELNEERKETRKRSFDDEYNNELDRGKVKKVRTNSFDNNRPRYNNNPFQQRANQQVQWRNNGNTSNSGRYSNYNNNNNHSYYKFNRFQNCRQWNQRKNFKQNGRKYYNGYYQSRY